MASYCVVLIKAILRVNKFIYGDVQYNMEILFAKSNDESFRGNLLDSYYSK